MTAATLDDRFRDPRFTHALLQRLPAFLATQRWFTSKGRELKQCKVRRSFRVGDDGALVLLETHYADGDHELYQLPLAELSETAKQKDYLKQYENGILLRIPGGPWIVDAVTIPAFRRRLYRLVRAGARTEDGLDCECGKVLVRAPQSLDGVLPDVDSSNTAIVFGDRYFFKLFRKLDPGLNPDLELIRHLSEFAGFAHCPPYAGSLGVGMMSDPNYLNLGLMTGKVDNRGDAWAYFQELVGNYFADGAEEVDETTLERVRLLGQRTAEMHLALAGTGKARVGAGAGAMIVPEAMTTNYRQEIAAAANKLLDRQMAELRRKAPELGDYTRGLAERVLDLAPAIADRFARFTQRDTPFDLIRIHADYHLGQVLVTPDDYVIIDFEGEPLLTIPERRRRRPALKDVAGMVRSFHYAIHAYQLQRSDEFRDWNPARLSRATEGWYVPVVNAYLDAYFATAGDASFLPATTEERRELLDLFRVEKAVYEVAYELNARPHWLYVPLTGVLRVMG